MNQSHRNRPYTHFADGWLPGAAGMHWTTRRRIMAVLRMAYRVLGLKRDRLGLGALGAGGAGSLGAVSIGGGATGVGQAAHGALASFFSGPGLLAGASLIALASPQAAWAANECGIDNAGATIITCPPGSYPTGIDYLNTGDAFTLTVNDAATTIGTPTTTSNPSVRVDSSATNTGDIVINANAFNAITNTGTGGGIWAINDGTAGATSITLGANAGAINLAGWTSSTGTQAVYARNNNVANASDVAVTVNGGSIAITNLGGGARASTAGSGNATVTMTGGSMALQNQVLNGGGGLMADSKNGNATATLSGGAISVNSPYLHGVTALTDNDTASTTVARVNMTGGTVTQSGAGYGLWASTNGLGGTEAYMSGGVINALNGGGVFSTLGNSGASNPANSSTAYAEISGGTINALKGMFAGGDGIGGTMGSAHAVMSGGTINFGGGGSYGITTSVANNTGSTLVELTGGTIAQTAVAGGGTGVSAVTTGNGTGSAAVEITGPVTITTTNGVGVAATAGPGGGGTGTGAATILMTDGSVSAVGNGLAATNRKEGIAAITVQGGSVTAAGTGTGLLSTVSNAASTADATIDLSGGTIAATGSGHGASATTSGLGTADVTMTGGAITTNTGRGISSTITNAANTQTVTASISNGSVSTTGAAAYGVYANTTGLGATDVTMSGGTVTTAAANGLYSQISNVANASDATVDVTGGAITAGGSGYGALATTNGTGDATATMSGAATSIATNTGAGLAATITNATSTATASASMADGTITAVGGGNGSAGVLAVSAGLGNVSTRMDGGSITIGGTAAPVSAIHAGLRSQISNSASTGVASATMTAGTISTTDGNDYGVHVHNSGNGLSEITFDSGTITTAGEASHGLVIWSDNGTSTGQNLVSMNGGTIATGGTFAEGIRISNISRGDNIVELNGGSITTTGDGAAGIGNHMRNAASTAMVRTTITGGSIDTAGTFSSNAGLTSYGVFNEQQGTGNSLIELIPGTGDPIDIQTSGAGMSALRSSITNVGSAGNSAIDIGGGTVGTTGSVAHAAYASTSGTGTSSITMTDGSVTATGAGSDGLRVQSTGGTYAVDVSGGTVTGGSGQGAGIHTLAAAGGTVDVGAAAMIDGSASGIAIRDGDADGDGVDEIGGNTMVTSAGTVTGDAILGLGDDSFALTGGSYTGTIYGDDVAASAADGDDSFTWSGGALAGGFVGGNGSDTAVVSAAGYDGSQLLDGGDDASSADGWVDTLTLNGVSGTLNGGNIQNWEVVNVTGGPTTITDLVTETVGVCGGSLTLGGASSADDVLGCVSNDSITLTGDTQIANVVEGAGGADTIAVLGNASVAGGVYGGGDGSDASAAADTGDTITINTTGTVALVDGQLGDDTITLTAGTVTGAVSGGDGNDGLTWSGGTLGSLNGGMGSDTALVSAAGYDGSQLLDGGDDVSTADGMTDSLTLQGVTVTANGANIANWEVVTLDASNVTIADGALTVGSDPGTGISLTNASTLNGGNGLALTGNMAIASGSTFDITGGGAGVYSVSGSLLNDGVVTSVDGAAGDVLTVGNYAGAGELRFDVDFLTDVGDHMVVNGDVTGGVTTILANALTTTASGNDVLMVDVGGASPAGMFMLASGPLSVGGQLYTLEQIGSDWFLTGLCSDNQTVSGASGDVLGCVTPDTLTVTTGGVVTGDLEGAGDVDIITIDGDAVVAGIVHGGGDGADMSAASDAGDVITVNTTGSVGGVDGDLGDDQIWMLGGTSTGDVLGNVGNDRITLNGATVQGTIGGGDGDDAFNLLSGTANAVTGDAGNDVIQLSGVTITTDIDAGAGNDTAVLASGNVGGAVLGGDGNDAITLAGANVGGAITGDAGDDSLTWTSGTLGSFNGGTGSDTAAVSVAGYDGSTVLDGGDDTSSADGWIDTLSLNGVTATVNGGNLKNWEVVNVIGGPTTITDLVTETVGVCGGSLTLGGASSADDVLGCVSNDSITLTGDTQIANVVEGAGGADTIAVLGNASVAGGVYGGGDGSDASAAADTGDTITINTTGTVALVDGQLGNDTIALNAGTITGDVLGGDGNDAITLAGASVGTQIDGGAGDDTLAWSAGSVPAIHGGTGSDTLSVTAAGYDGSQLLDGGDDTSIADGMVDRLTLGGLDVTANGSDIANWEVATLDDTRLTIADGAWTVGDAGDNTTGVFLTNGSDLDALNALVLTGNLAIGPTSRFIGTGGGAGVYEITGNVRNDGTITTLDGAVGDVVKVGGDYAGDGQLLFDANLDTETSDTLLIAGDVTGGTTGVVINDVGSGVGTYTGPDGGILVVGVGGDAAGDSFALAPQVMQVGVYDYTLGQKDDGNFYLTSNYRSGVPTIEALGAGILSLSGLPTLQQRVGNRNWTATRDPYRDHGAIWGTIEGSTGQLGPKVSTTGSVYDIDQWKARIGLDLPLSDTDKGGLMLGLFGHYGEGKTKVTSALTDDGDIRNDVWGGGVSLTWYGAKGFYADGQLHYNDVGSDLYADASGSTRLARVKAEGLSGGLEVGYRIGSNSFAIIPQAQVYYSSLSYDAFDMGTMHIDGGKAESLRGRIGVAINSQTFGDNGKATHLYGILNLLNEFEGKNTMWAAGTPIRSHPEKLWGEVGLGFTHNFSDRFSVFGEGGYETAFSNSGDNYNLKGRLGLRVALGGRREAAPPPPPPPPIVRNEPPAPPPLPPQPVCNKGPYIVFFDWDKSDITPEAAMTLDSAVAAYGNCATVPIMLAGYADRSGSAQYNFGLSQRRNASVQSYLTGRGVSASAITSEGFGETNPRVPTADGVRELQNRRVEITYGPGSGY